MVFRTKIVQQSYFKPTLLKWCLNYIIVPCGTHLPVFIYLSNGKIDDYQEIEIVKTSKSGRTKHILFYFGGDFEEKISYYYCTADFSLLRVKEEDDNSLIVFYNSKVEYEYRILKLAPQENNDRYGYINKNGMLISPKPIYEYNGKYFNPALVKLCKMMRLKNGILLCGYYIPNESLPTTLGGKIPKSEYDDDDTL
ncbi:MAG: hypothetical protein ACK4NF_06965 [Planctomycetota bacterium]